MRELGFDQPAQSVRRVLDPQHVARVAVSDEAANDTATGHGVQVVLHFCLIRSHTKESAAWAQAEGVAVFIAIHLSQDH